jgi:hypothetical protein
MDKINKQGVTWGEVLYEASERYQHFLQLTLSNC